MNDHNVQILAEDPARGFCIYRMFNGKVQIDLSYAGAVLPENELCFFVDLIEHMPRESNPSPATARFLHYGPQRFVCFCQRHDVYTIVYGHALLRMPAINYDSFVALCRRALEALGLPLPETGAAPTQHGFSMN